MRGATRPCLADLRGEADMVAPGVSAIRAVGGTGLLAIDAVRS
jgi:hypothetical protein